MIYWVKAGETGAVKVGYAASDVTARIRLLQIGCPSPLKLLREELGERDLETALHRHYRNKRLRGEWFLLTDEDVSVDIRAIKPRVKIMRDSPDPELLSDVEGFLARSGMTPTRFGECAVRDPGFVHQLRAGRECRRSTRTRVAAFIASHTQSRSAA